MQAQLHLVFVQAFGPENVGGYAGDENTEIDDGYVCHSRCVIVERDRVAEIEEYFDRRSEEYVGNRGADDEVVGDRVGNKPPRRARTRPSTTSTPSSTTSTDWTAPALRSRTTSCTSRATAAAGCAPRANRRSPRASTRCLDGRPTATPAGVCASRWWTPAGTWGRPRATRRPGSRRRRASPTSRAKEEVVDQHQYDPYAGHGTFAAGIIRCLAPQAEHRDRGRAAPRPGPCCESKIVQELTEALTDGDHPDIISIQAGAYTRGDRGMPELEKPA